MKDFKICLSHKSDNWRTPSELYNLFINKYHFEDLFEYCSSYDQYEIKYDNRRLFCNPPYSDMNRVADYILELKERNNIIFLLVPVRTDTKWFRKLWEVVDHIIFISGRLHFNDSKSAPFPSMLMVFNMLDIETYSYYHLYDYNELLRHLDLCFYINRFDVIKKVY